MHIRSIIAIALVATLIEGRSIGNFAPRSDDSPLLIARGGYDENVSLDRDIKILVARVPPGGEAGGDHVIDIPKAAVERQKEEEYTARVMQHHADQGTEPPQWAKDNSAANQEAAKKAAYAIGVKYNGP